MRCYATSDRRIMVPSSPITTRAQLLGRTADLPLSGRAGSKESQRTREGERDGSSPHLLHSRLRVLWWSPRAPHFLFHRHLGPMALVHHSLSQPYSGGPSPLQPGPHQGRHLVSFQVTFVPRMGQVQVGRGVCVWEADTGRFQKGGPQGCRGGQWGVGIQQPGGGLCTAGLPGPPLL